MNPVGLRLHRATFHIKYEGCLIRVDAVEGRQSYGLAVVLSIDRPSNAGSIPIPVCFPNTFPCDDR